MLKPGGGWVRTIINNGHNAVASCYSLNPQWLHIEITNKMVSSCLACVALIVVYKGQIYFHYHVVLKFTMYISHILAKLHTNIAEGYHI